ncbi:MAG TPA: TonB-dependent receptor [Alloacidobacterium sp.]|nr:TonB-dependent receptor [Alloacidobacterium sp.]
MITQAHMHDHSLQCQHASKARDQSLKRIFLEGDMTRLYAVCVMCLAVCLTLSPLSAQVKSSAITGTVSDPTGAVVPNATVTVLNEGTAVSTETKTTEKGDYTVPYLPVGHYTLLVNAAGFKTYRKIGIVLVSATTVREDVSLMLGETNATVTVKAGSLALQTDSPTVQSSVGEQLIQNLPNINNNPLYWSTLQAGVVPDSNMLNSQALGVGFTDRQSMSEFRINGTELGSNDIQLDGLSILGAGWHETAVLPNPDSLQEVSVTSNTFPADTGLASGVVSMTTKSGTNEFHGDLNYMLRNEALNANGFYNNYYQIPRPKYRLLQGGGSIGGPVIIPRLFNGKDKLFFFVSYLRLTHSSPDTFLGKVPTDLERRGNFSQTMVPNVNGVPENVHIYDPFTAAPYQGSTTTFVRQMYPNAIVTNPNPYGLKLLQSYPEPNHTPSDAFNDNNYFFSGTIPEVRDSLNTRVDYRIGKHSFYFTGGIAKGSVTPPNAWGSGNPFQNMPWPGVTTDQNPYGAIGDTITLNPTTLVDIRYGVTHIDTQSRIPPATGIDGSTYGVPSSVGALNTLSGDTPSVGNFNTNDGANQGNYTSLGAPTWDNKHEAQLNHDVVGSITKVLGNWTLKGGAEYRVYLGNWMDLVWPTPAIGVQLGAFNMPSGSGKFSTVNGNNDTALITDPADLGYSLTSAVTGVSGWGMIGGSGVPVATAAKYVAFYTQNSWKATRRLTLSLGLRYELQPGPTERYNRMASINLNMANPYSSGSSIAGNPLGGLGVMTFPGVAGYSRNLYKTEYGNVSPRLGVAFQLNKSTVIRGGFGRNYMPSNTGFNANGTIYGTEPFSPSAYPIPFGLSPNGSPVGTFDQPGNTNIIPAVGANQSATLYGTIGGGVDLFNRYLYKTGVTDQWNVIVERAFGPEWLVSIGYVGSRSTNLPWRGFNINGPWNVPSGTLQSWRSTWLASNGTNDPSQVQVPNPLPALIGKATGDIGNVTISAMEAQENYLPFLGQTDFRSAGSSNYNSMEIRVQHAYNHGVLLMANYTWSKAMGLTGGTWSQSMMESQAGGSVPPYGGVDYLNQHNNYSLLGFDTPNRFVAAVSYLLPIGEGMALDPGNKIANAIIGQWQVSSAVTLQSGNPWGPSCGTLNGRCNVVAGEPVQVPKHLQHWYDGSTSVTLPDGRTITPPEGTFLKWNPDRWTQPVVQFPNGTYGPDYLYTTNGSSAMTQGDLRIPAFENVNLSVVRKFNFGERVNLELHADATNAFNHTNFLASEINNGVSPVVSLAGTTPGTAIGQNANTGFGTLSTSGWAGSFLEPRQLTLSLQLNF